MTINEPTYADVSGLTVAMAVVGFVSFFFGVAAAFAIRTGGGVIAFARRDRGVAAIREVTTGTRDIRAGAVNIANDRDGNGAGSTTRVAFMIAGVSVTFADAMVPDATVSGAALSSALGTMRDGRATDAAITTASTTDTKAALITIRGATIAEDPRATRRSARRPPAPDAFVTCTIDDHGIVIARHITTAHAVPIAAIRRLTRGTACFTYSRNSPVARAVHEQSHAISRHGATIAVNATDVTARPLRASVRYA